MQVSLQAVATALAAVPGLLVPAERAGWVELVNVLAQTTPARSWSATQRIREPLSVQMPADRPNGVFVGLLDGLRGGAEGQHGQHRAEDLLAGDAVRLGDAGEDRRREPESPCWAGRRRGTSARRLRRRRPRRAPGSWRGSAESIRADVGVLVQRSPTPGWPSGRLSRSRPLATILTSRREPAKDVALVEEDAVDDALDGLVDRGCRARRSAALPPSLLEGDRLSVPAIVLRSSGRTSVSR